MAGTVLTFCTVSQATLASHRIALLRSLSDRFRGMGFTADGSSWRGDWGDGHGHVAESMGILWLDVADCPQCIEHEYPGWQVAYLAGEGYTATDGERVIYGRSRTALICRLALATGGPS